MKPRGRGFDSVEYKATKFNSVSRSYSIPHPIAYAQLAKCIVDNWNVIEPFQNSHVSMIRPRQHKDGRIIIMDYERFAARATRVRDLAFNKRYAARTDITSCFGSIYTHAIPWAAVGVAAAKASTTGGWFNTLDKHTRRCTRDETQGIPIGPGTSNIIAEIILSEVDKKLAPEFHFARGAATNGMSRFIDDYSFYCDSFDEAERFIRRLDEELGVFKMRLNARKTSIITPVTPFGDRWASELALRLPTGGSLDSYRCTNYLEFASALASQFPDGSILKYAASALVRSPLTASAEVTTLDYLLVLSPTNPVLLPLLEKLFDSTKIGGAIRFPSRILDILGDSAARHRSDAMAWTLYYAKKYNIAIPSTTADEVIKTNDCIAILCLFLTGQHLPKIVNWTTTLDKSDAYTLDRYWIVLYQLHQQGHIGSDFCSVPKAFADLKAANVSFVV
ncbi:RNA-directed DNA polymerase [Microcoleus sp. AR_TQ3_B6]|uniref:RNA-directed DNA polymerase n=1 Tax=Microcoleus sp. AR_TQ3_B6 TaxID=3055284 RepID=UPI002FD1362E